MGPVWRVRWFAGAPVWWCSKLPRGPAGYGPSARDESSAPGERRQESKSLPSAPLGISAICPASYAAEPRGVREPYAGAGCHATPEGNRSFCCGYNRVGAGGNGIGLSACADSEDALGESRLQGSQASLNSNCQKTGESTFLSPTTRHIACKVVVNALQQYERLASLATAKLQRRCPILGLAHPPMREKRRIHWRFTRVAC